MTLNMLSLSPNCIVIEEEDINFYHMLNDLGFDVITVPMKYFVMFGGCIHCSTWDIRRDEDLTDYFPVQDYEAECKQDLKKDPSTKPIDYTPYKCDEKFNHFIEETWKKV